MIMYQNRRVQRDFCWTIIIKIHLIDCFVNYYGSDTVFSLGDYSVGFLLVFELDFKSWCYDTRLRDLKSFSCESPVFFRVLNIYKRILYKALWFFAFITATTGKTVFQSRVLR